MVCGVLVKRGSCGRQSNRDCITGFDIVLVMRGTGGSWRFGGVWGWGGVGVM